MHQNIVYEQIYHDVSGRKRPLIIGINGAYTSGKTVFTSGFADYLRERGEKVQVIHYDDFHNPFSAITWTDDTEIDVFYNHAFDPEKLERQLLRPLREQGRFRDEILCVDLGTSTFSNLLPFDIDDQTIVLLEGVLLYRPPLLPYIDYKVFLDITSEEMLHRAKQRDVPRFGEAILEKFVTRYIPVQQRYLAEWSPEQISDIVVDNSDYLSPEIRNPSR